MKITLNSVDYGVNTRNVPEAISDGEKLAHQRALLLSEGMEPVPFERMTVANSTQWVTDDPTAQARLTLLRRRLEDAVRKNPEALFRALDAVGPFMATR
jgi:hypothetical protein